MRSVARHRRRERGARACFRLVCSVSLVPTFQLDRCAAPSLSLPQATPTVVRFRLFFSLGEIVWHLQGRPFPCSPTVATTTDDDDDGRTTLRPRSSWTGSKTRRSRIFFFFFSFPPPSSFAYDRGTSLSRNFLLRSWPARLFSAHEEPCSTSFDVSSTAARPNQVRLPADAISAMCRSTTTISRGRDLSIDSPPTPFILRRRRPILMRLPAAGSTCGCNSPTSLHRRRLRRPSSPGTDSPSCCTPITRPSCATLPATLTTAPPPSRCGRNPFTRRKRFSASSSASCRAGASTASIRIASPRPSKRIQGRKHPRPNC